MKYDFTTLREKLIQYLDSEYVCMYSEYPDTLDLTSEKELYELSKIILHELKCNGNFLRSSFDQFESNYNTQTKMTGNWWEWRIGIPYNYIYICLLADVDKKSCDKTLNKFVRRFAKYGDLTYANQASICKNLFMLGILMENETYIDESLRLAVKAFKPTNLFKANIANKLQKFCIRHPKFPHPTWLFKWKEGLYPDGTFIQHTSIPYIGTYGKEMLQFAAMVLSCGVQLPDKIMSYLLQWIKAFELNIYKCQIMLMNCGRSADKVDAFNEASEMIKYLRQINIHPENSEFTLLFQEYGDRVIYQTPKFRFCIAGSSDRIASYEGFDGNNLFGRNQGLGATYLYLPEDKNYKYGYFSRVGYESIPGTLIESPSCVESKQPLFDYDPKYLKDLKFSCSGSLVTMQYHSNLFGSVSKYWGLLGDSIVCYGESDYPAQCVVDNRYNAELEVTEFGVFDKANRIEYYGVFEINDTQIVTKSGTRYQYKIHVL
ncbi:MAG: polysaccharide lyase family 8 super-sandwich domain-containing protein [Bacillota bacterium]|nr:polysaccharide lyase family 8 super-sandwich domain-containing protein [Bacillota bacterium]